VEVYRLKERGSLPIECNLTICAIRIPRQQAEPAFGSDRTLSFADACARMTNLLSSYVLGQILPGGSEIDNYALPSDAAAVGVRPVQWSVVDQHGDSRFHRVRYLTTQIRHGCVCRYQTFSVVGVCVWKQRVNRGSHLMRAGQDPKRWCGQLQHDAIVVFTSAESIRNPMHPILGMFIAK
jgi:hypothetical protein